ncbi:helix-turn-helix domain-containing GNAT family N-acetyltransferase [Pseudonocardia sp.]|uniref:bifunctional helix-turn-helix transcriptional regulator/GNAT family N-acetyltransferase n=1 Tax=Pseudonocardia sp. TaxID=60912 RepID=UPI002628A93F|nr:helix-turn-helix domain-containing GNAT family N-acetyltransferase [Pseudonocardia sp.]
MSTTVGQVRAFNRFYTRVIGALDAGLTGTPHSLTEARVLFEIATGDVVEVARLRVDLGLDAGYLSRILARLTTGGLVAREQAADDGRKQVVGLTPAGRAAFARLDAGATASVERLVAPLDEARQGRLVDAMRTIRTLLGDAPPPAPYVLRGPEPGDLGWVVARHGALYAAEYGWDATFETLVARIVGGFDTRRDAAWIAEVDGERLGCVFCTAGDDPATAQLRLLLVDPSARGSGVGRRLVEECLRHARHAGYARIALWTNDVLGAARRIYVDAGFTLDREEPHHSFGRDLVGQFWSLEL